MIGNDAGHHWVIARRIEEMPFQVGATGSDFTSVDHGLSLVNIY
jgi:hypothetical protein